MGFYSILGEYNMFRENLYFLIKNKCKKRLTK